MPIGIPSGWEEIAAFYWFRGLGEDLMSMVNVGINASDYVECRHDWQVTE